jgi:hypothetical protein
MCRRLVGQLRHWCIGFAIVAPKLWRLRLAGT